MSDGGSLQERFGRLVAAHRRRARLTQEDLANAANLSADMIGRIEQGHSGARFGTIERLAKALNVDPAELFTGQLDGKLHSPELASLTARLAALSVDDLAWLSSVIDAALKRRN